MMNDRQFRLLLNGLEDVYAAETVPQYVEGVNHLLRQAVQPQQISWVFLDPSHHRFHASCVFDATETAAGSHHQVIRPGGWSFQVLEKNKPCYHPDTRTAPNINPRVIQSGVRTYAGFPVLAHQSPVATVFVNRRDTDAYSPEDRMRISTILRECAPRLVQLSSGTVPPTGNEAPLVLHVDDLDLMRTMCRKVFQRFGIASLSTNSLAGAEDLLKTHAPSVLLLDFDLGHVTGFDVWQMALRDAHLKGRIPPASILYSSRVSASLEASAKAMGFFDVMRKGEQPITALPTSVLAAHQWHASAADFCRAS